MAVKRDSDRIIQRLECEFSAGETTHRSISSDISENGLFIRTRHGLGPGSVIDITLYLPDGRASKVRGIVRRTIKTDFSGIKNGMGVELIEKDAAFINLLRSHSGDIMILTCAYCGTKNKVPKDKLHMRPKCGICKAALKV